MGLKNEPWTMASQFVLLLVWGEQVVVERFEVMEEYVTFTALRFGVILRVSSEISE